MFEMSLSLGLQPPDMHHFTIGDRCGHVDFGLRVLYRVQNLVKDNHPILLFHHLYASEAGFLVLTLDGMIPSFLLLLLTLLCLGVLVSAVDFYKVLDR